VHTAVMRQPRHIREFVCPSWRTRSQLRASPPLMDSKHSRGTVLPGTDVPAPPPVPTPSRRDSCSL
jgi:hypothetical protein